MFSVRWISFLFVVWTLPTSSMAGRRAILTVMETASWDYASEISEYGVVLNRMMVYAASLMIPPGDPQLCSFPQDYTTLGNNYTLPVRFRTPVALMVSLGGCEIEDKLQIALDIHEQISPSVQFFVFYNNDAQNHDEIVSLTPPTQGGNITDSIAFLSVSAGAGSSMMRRIQQHAAITGTSSEFLGTESTWWDLPMYIKAVTETTFSGRTVFDDGARVDSGNFYWFRFVLFALLIVSPCCRGAYLWWAGGGRINFRRNENGRINGLQYIPPISYWFAANGAQDSGYAVSGRLTEAQVLALPEIVYKALEEATEKEIEGNDEAPLEPLEDLDIVVNAGSDDAELSAAAEETTLETEKPVVNARSDEEQPIESPNYSTNCTTCSICIDEFEDGEKIRLLPRCLHAFHTECIMPWLTERQGCCPLCKASVIESENEEEGSAEQTEDVEPTATEDTATERESIGVTPSHDDESGSVSGQQLQQETDSDPVRLAAGSEVANAAIAEEDIIVHSEEETRVGSEEDRSSADVPGLVSEGEENTKSSAGNVVHEASETEHGNENTPAIDQ